MKLWKRTIAIFLSTFFITAMPISANALEETSITAPSAVLMEPETGNSCLCVNNKGYDTSSCI